MSDKNQKKKHITKLGIAIKKGGVLEKALNQALKTAIEKQSPEDVKDCLEIGVSPFDDCYMDETYLAYAARWCEYDSGQEILKAMLQYDKNHPERQKNIEDALRHAIRCDSVATVGILAHECGDIQAARRLVDEFEDDDCAGDAYKALLNFVLRQRGRAEDDGYSPGL